MPARRAPPQRRPTTAHGVQVWVWLVLALFSWVSLGSKDVMADSSLSFMLAQHVHLLLVLNTVCAATLLSTSSMVNGTIFMIPESFVTSRL